MRHIGSFWLAVILGPAIWALTGIGAGKFAEARAASASFNTDLAIAVAAIAGAAVCYSVLVLSRVSPIGPVLVGLAFLAATGWRVADYAMFTDRVPDKLLGIPGAGQLPAEGYAALLGIPLLLTLFSARRWRRLDPPDYPPAPAAAPQYSQPQPGLAPTYLTSSGSPVQTNYSYTDTSTPPYPTIPPYPSAADDPETTAAFAPTASTQDATRFPRR